LLGFLDLWLVINSALTILEIPESDKPEYHSCAAYTFIYLPQ
jgi:hypothetical protein